MPTYQWVATEMLTGNVICDLPGLICQNPQQTIGQYNTCTATLPIPTASPGWERAVVDGGAVIWLVAETPSGSTVPVWGGYVVTAQRDHTDLVTLSLCTLEGYLTSRYTGDRTYTAEDQNQICADLITNCVASGPQGGIPAVTNIVGGAGAAQTIAWQDQSDTTVYSAMQSLTALQGGPEWCITGRWDGAGRIIPVFNVGTRLGTPQTAGLSPAVVLDLPGNLAGFAVSKSFASTSGANSVMAYSSGTGTSRPQSPVQNQPDPLRPTFEFRWSPQQNTLSVPQLTVWAQQALTVLSTGSPSLVAMLKIDGAQGATHMIDWQLGDDVGYAIGTVPRSDGSPSVPAFPRGLSGVARVIGFTYNVADTMSMQLVLAGGDLMQYDVEQNLNLFQSSIVLTEGTA